MILSYFWCLADLRDVPSETNVIFETDNSNNASFTNL